MRTLLILTTLLFALGCKQQAATKAEAAENESAEQTEKATQLPEALTAIIDAHGGMKAWKNMRTMRFTIPKENNPEVHTIDLWSRKDRIDTPDYAMGFDGSQPWVLEKEKAYGGNAEFYHNLMFYFYAMPFVLSDSGIVYGETPDLVFEGRSYPGIGIAYGEGVGTSPKDEYFVHYDPDTKQMAWLGYTVTYRSGEKSDNVKWIRYDDWEAVDGLLLPASISWFEYEGRTLKAPRSTVPFTEASVTETALSASEYAKPEGGTYFVKPAE
ncbi:DUF6503 family protein [Flagellimonas sp. DF-77]|uniref:DUF6503 family protein n=1 Tax=Flagellimonas algarum TaxID=3230298 RepID=UPI003395FEB3